MFGLLGPNGSGKSTLMRTLATLQAPDRGTFSLDRVDGLREPRAIRQRLGYLPQQIGAYPGVSARDLLRRFCYLKGIAAAEVAAVVEGMLERVNLRTVAADPVSTYSGGMLRRFGIAIALLGRPRLLIVDEPTAGLDPVERNVFHQLLATVAQGAVVLLSTHIVEDVENLCDQVAILRKGGVVMSGSPEELCATLDDRLWATTLELGAPPPDAFLHCQSMRGGLRVVVASPTPPGRAYEHHRPRLEDVYHCALQAPR